MLHFFGCTLPQHDSVAVIKDEYVRIRYAQIVGQLGVGDKHMMLAVDGHEVFRLHK